MIATTGMNDVTAYKVYDEYGIYRGFVMRCMGKRSQWQAFAYDGRPGTIIRASRSAAFYALLTATKHA